MLSRSPHQTRKTDAVCDYHLLDSANLPTPAPLNPMERRLLPNRVACAEM